MRDSSAESTTVTGSSPGRHTEAYQRYLLQVGYTDAALGLVLRRLRETGLYDRALVIVTADHGVGFRPRRPATPLRRPTNLDEIGFVPLFVKLPGQRRGRIGDALGEEPRRGPDGRARARAPLRSKVEGRPLVGTAARRRDRHGAEAERRPRDGAALALRARRSPRARLVEIAMFGSGPSTRLPRRAAPRARRAPGCRRSRRLRGGHEGRGRRRDAARLGRPRLRSSPSFVEGRRSRGAPGRRSRSR